MYNAKLYRGFRINSFYDFSKAFYSIHAGDENIMYAAVLEFSDGTEQALNSFVPGNP